MAEKSRLEMLASKLNRKREELNRAGFHVEGTSDMDVTSNFNDVMPFVAVYESTVMSEFPELGSIDEALCGHDLFTEMTENGLDDKTAIEFITETIGKALGSDEDDEEHVGESSLTEGASNFHGDGGAEWLPLLVFMSDEEVWDKIKYYAEQEYVGHEDEQDWDEFLQEFADEHYDEYSQGVCVLDDDEIKALEEKIDEFNYEIHRQGESITGTEEYDDGDILKNSETEIKGGYYEGYQIFTEFQYKDDENLSEELRKPFQDFYAEIKKEFGLTELSVAYKASNGETGYRIVEEARDEAKRNHRLGECDKVKESVSWSYFDKFDPIFDQYLPDYGEGDDMATQAVTAVCKLVYKWYNDGDVFDNVMQRSIVGFGNDLASYANWLYHNVPETRKILTGIKKVRKDGDYEDLLQKLADAVLDAEKLDGLSQRKKEGSVYEGDFPFSYEFRSESEYDESLHEDDDEIEEDDEPWVGYKISTPDFPDSEDVYFDDLEEAKKAFDKLIDEGTKQVRLYAVQEAEFSYGEDIEELLFSYDDDDEDESIKESSKDYYEYPAGSGCHVRETESKFVAIGKNGETIGESDTKAGAEALIDAQCKECVNEDTVKQGGHWVNKGKEGTHGKFRTKKQADAQRKAMFANGYKESTDLGEGVKYHDFLDDKEKMRDFKKLSKSDFLKSYSYLTELEYDLTAKALKDKNKANESADLGESKNSDNPYLKNTRIKLGKGEHVNKNAGDPVKNMQAFNHAMGEGIDAEAEPEGECDHDCEASMLSNEFSKNVKDEWDAIEGYNILKTEIEASSLTDEEKAKLVAIVDDIRGEEYRHVGQLETAVKTVAPQADDIEKGKEEADGQEASAEHHEEPEEHAEEIASEEEETIVEPKEGEGE